MTTDDVELDRSSSSEPELVTLAERPTAVVRGVVPMAELPAFYDRAFGQLPGAIAAQEIAIEGPAFGLYRTAPGETVDLEVGFVVDRTVEPAGDVVPAALPGGWVARMVHHGSFDGLGDAWGRLGAWIGAQGLTPGAPFWEVYLTEPSPDMDPNDLRTELHWPVAD